MQSINKFNKEVRILLCVINIYSKNAVTVPLKDKKGIIITVVFQELLDAPGCKPNKILVDQVNGFDNRSLNLWLRAW